MSSAQNQSQDQLRSLTIVEFVPTHRDSWVCSGVVAEEVVVAVDVAVEPNVFAVEVAVAEWGVSMAH